MSSTLPEEAGRVGEGLRHAVTLPVRPEASHLRLFLGLCSSGRLIRRLPPIILCLIQASSASFRLFNSIVKPEPRSLASRCCQRRGRLKCAKIPLKNRNKRREDVGNVSSLLQRGWILFRKLCFFLSRGPNVPTESPDASRFLKTEQTAAINQSINKSISTIPSQIGALWDKLPFDAQQWSLSVITPVPLRQAAMVMQHLFGMREVLLPWRRDGMDGGCAGIQHGG